MSVTKFTAIRICLAGLFAAASPSLTFASVHFETTSCIPRDIRDVHAHLVNYASYQSLDNQLRFSVAPLGPVPLVNMTYSIPTFRGRVGAPSHTETADTDALVWVVLQPYLINRPEDQSLLPRFYLHCRSNWNSNHNSFQHTCDRVNPPYTGASANSLLPSFGLHLTHPIFTGFGISGFRSELSVTTYQLGQSGAPENCHQGDVILSYRFEIQPQQDEVRSIKEEVLRRFLGRWALIPLISEIAERQIAPLFDESNENCFYLWYYREFYRAWSSSIPRHDFTP